MADLTDVMAEDSRRTDLYQRMDADKSLLILDEYEMKDSDDNTVDDVINVTMNTPATFLAHVQSALVSASAQVSVTGNGMDDDKTHPIELFLDAFYLVADARLRLAKRPQLKPYSIQQLLGRGRAGTRITCRMKDGVFIPDVLPCDTRYLLYDTDEDGLVWTAYKTTRSITEIKARYPNLLESIPKPASNVTSLQVVDLWDRTTNKVFVGGLKPGLKSSAQQVFEEPNTWGYVPFVIEMVELGLMFNDDDSIKHIGESLLFLSRMLYEEDNRLASIMQTLNMLSVNPAKTYNTGDGKMAKLPEHDVSAPGVTTPLGTDESVNLVPSGDVKQAGIMMTNKISTGIQIGTQSKADYGTTDFPMPAVAIIELAEASGEVFLPRLAALARLYEGQSAMIIDQVQKLRVGTREVTEISMGTKGHKQSWSVAALKGDYDILYEYTVKSPQTDLARRSVADIAKGFLDEDTIDRDILKLANPTEVKRKRSMERARLQSPELDLYMIGEDILAQAELEKDEKKKKALERRATIIAHALNMTIEGLQRGDVPPRQQREEPVRNKVGQAMKNTPGTKANSNMKSQRGKIEPREGA